MDPNQETFRQTLNHAVDYDRVLSRFSSYASFSLSKQAIEQALPGTDRYQIREDLSLVKEAVEYLRQGHTLSMQGCTDLYPSIKRAEKGMVLSTGELLEIALFLQACQTAQNSLRTEGYDKLQEYASSMDPCTKLKKELFRCIDDAGQMKENASPALAGHYARLRSLRDDLTTTTRRFMASNSDKLMERVTVSVSSRTCVLVKSSDKNAFGGMIHGQSQSGSAFYVEPAVFVEKNNRIQLEVSAIEEEIARICRQLSSSVRQNAAALAADLETMTILDAAMAKAHWCLDHDGCIPVLSESGRTVDLEYARHPLLDPQKVVPNNYRLEENQRVLMITGPNMGGKTVTLKTIGLFVALSLAGFPVSAHRARLPYYTSLFFDIGDQQSIENNLSTFSSHISSLSAICANCDEHSFILLDEVGNGTDPLEGSALAVAILEFLMKKQCTVITSTHYNGVKSFGGVNPGVLVASMQFDSESLMPTYKYIPGVSGKSYAFDIARQYHLDPSILESAQKIKEQQENQNERELARLEQLQEEALHQKERFDQLIVQAHRIQKEADQAKEKWQKKQEELEREYRSSLDAMLQEKETEIQALFDQLRQEQALKPHQQASALHKLHSLQPRQQEPEPNEKLKEGDYVRIQGLDTHGEILEIRKKEALVLSNGLKIKMPVRRLTKIKRPMPSKPVRKEHHDRDFTRIPLELNVIGYRVEEGLQAVDRYIDQCVAHNLKQVRIIHGMGTGKLRAAILKDLSRHPAVKSTRAGGPGEGGLGATIVELK